MLAVYVLINVGCLLFLATGYASVLGDNEGVVFTSLGIGSLIGYCLESGRPRPPVSKAGDTVFAVYVPRRTEDVVDSTEICGVLLAWTAEWRIDKGRYKGEWAMVPGKVGGEHPFVAWVPLGDLVIQDRRKRNAPCTRT